MAKPSGRPSRQIVGSSKPKRTARELQFVWWAAILHFDDPRRRAEGDKSPEAA